MNKTAESRNTRNILPSTRRGFLKASATTMGGLSMSLGLSGCSSMMTRDMGEQGQWEANAWLEIKPDNQVIFTLDRVEMGQGTYTGLTTLVAEELDVKPEQVQVVFAPAAKPYRNPDYGLQITGGSNSLSSSWGQIREAGSATRLMLLEAAAEVFQVEASTLQTHEGFVINPASGKQVSYGELASLAVDQSIPEPQLKAASEFKYIGKHNKRLDISGKVNGTARYGIDVDVPGMVYAVISRSPVYGGQLVSFNADEIRQMPGVVDVLEISRGVAVVAEKYWQARKAQAALKIQWDDGELGDLTTEKVYEVYREAAADDAGDSHRSEGDFDEALGNARRVLETEYKAPFLAHSTMEPMNCTAHVREDGADIWAPTQGPDVARVAVAKVTNLSLDDVTIHNTFIGGGFGRRLTQDFVAEAAEVSYKSGRIIKLIWSREEDTRHDVYRPASLHKLKATFDRGGNLTGWDHQIVVPKILDWYVWDAAPAMFPWAPKMMYDFMGQSGLWTEGTPLTPQDTSPYEGAADMPYGIANVEVRHTKADVGIPVSYWRSVGHSHNAFVVESFIDELAFEMDEDPLAFRMKLLGNNIRHRQVLKLAAEKAGWNSPAAKGIYRGLAVHQSFKTYVAQIVEIKQVSGKFQVQKVTCAVDCGTVVNPDIVRMQMESGIIFGLTAALYGKIDLDQGRVVQSNFDDYPIVRMNEAPEIDVIIVDSAESPTGVGEPGLPPLAPALANALFAATGNRQRSLPLQA